MAPQRTERLLNLVIALVATRRWLTKEQIRRAVPQYAECETTEAFDRMFERDKEDLRELGVPLVTGTYDAVFDDEPGYRIDRAAYALPEIQFTAQELAVLGLASRVWQQASLAGPAARALTKLSALGVEVDTESLVGVEPRVRANEPAFDPLYAATRDRSPVRFRYRKPDGETTERHLQPWAMTSRGGHWYVVGLDTDRGAPRAFRLSRILGGVRRGRPGTYVIPPDVDVQGMVDSRPATDVRIAVLRVRPGRGTALRLRADQETPGDPDGTADASHDAPAGPSLDAPAGASLDAPASAPHNTPAGARAGWDVVRLPVGDLWMLAEQVASHGPDIVALEPPDLRDAVIRLLKGAAAAHPPAPGTRGSGHAPADPASRPAQGPRATATPSGSDDPVGVLP